MKERHVSDDEEMDYDADVKEEPDSGKFPKNLVIKIILLIGVTVDIKTEQDIKVEIKSEPPGITCTYAQLYYHL